MTDLARRRWLRSLVPGAAGAASELVERKVARRFAPQRRPPGAPSEPLFLAACTRCRACVEACPYNAVHVFTEAAGPVQEGTPVMRPDHRPCHMCEGFPCAAACDEGALEVPEELWRIGMVRVRADRCFTFQGPECGACVGVCPEGLEGMRLDRTRPQVVPEQCVGCGLCIDACPTIPKAIELVPLRPED